MKKEQKIELFQTNKICPFCHKEIIAYTIRIKHGLLHMCEECYHQLILKAKLEITENIRERQNKLTVARKFTPYELYEYLSNYIVEQEDALKKISVAVYKHFFMQSDTLKSNLLILGPTGSGKTEIAKRISAFCNTPTIIEDMSIYTPSGYRGNNLDEIIQNLFEAAQFEKEKTERGIVFLDEFDKVVEDRGENNFNILMQKSLLKLLEGKNVIVCKRGDGMSSEKIYIDTSNILFICMGAFTSIIDDKKEKIKMGFYNFECMEMDSEEVCLFKKVKQSGIIPELLGRFGMVVQLKKISKEALLNIVLYSKNSIIKNYQALFLIQNIHLKFKKESICQICEKAYLLGTGVRGVQQILDMELADELFELFQEKTSSS